MNIKEKTLTELPEEMRVEEEFNIVEIINRTMKNVCLEVIMDIEKKKSELTGDYETDKPVKYKIVALEELLKKFEEERK